MHEHPDNVTLLVGHIVHERGGALYHVTDERNLLSIAQHGILSKEQIEERGIECFYPGGNHRTWRLDRRAGLWDQVFLGFHAFTRMPTHHDKWHRRPYTIHVDPRVSHLPGVRIALGCANHAHRKVLPVDRAVAEMDQQAFLAAFLEMPNAEDDSFSRRRAQTAHYEILVPSVVPPEYLMAA